MRTTDRIGRIKKQHGIQRNYQEAGGTAIIGAKSSRNRGVRAPLVSNATCHAVRVVSDAVFVCRNKCALKKRKNVMKNSGKNIKNNFFI